MIEYKKSTEGLAENNLKGFFVGWPNPPDEKTFLELLHKSYRVILAINEGEVIGFITAISDGVLSAYIPFLEVLPEYQAQGIGKELVTQMKKELSHLYMIDLLCDVELIPYYEKQGMSAATGALIRNYENQNGSNV
jgi:ribosomal protein S18 acetylase RimI-like enzyme